MCGNDDKAGAHTASTVAKDCPKFIRLSQPGRG